MPKIPMNAMCLVTVLLALGACAPAPPPASPPAGGSASPSWARPPLSPAEVPGVFLAVWREAENRTTCAPLAPASIASTREGEPRAARFASGWGVAYDLPGQRSAFGVAGTGVLAAEPSYDEWPHHIEWSDGSTAGYGPEGGTGPNLLAYLRIPRQGCLYNVWSRLGREHLETLLGDLRFVRTEG